MSRRLHAAALHTAAGRFCDDARFDLDRSDRLIPNEAQAVPAECAALRGVGERSEPGTPSLEAQYLPA